MTDTGDKDTLSHAASTSIVSHADLMIPEGATTVPLARYPSVVAEVEAHARTPRLRPGWADVEMPVHAELRLVAQPQSSIA
jgi:hypothetical protein